MAGASSGSPAAGYSQAAQETPPEGKSRSLRLMVIGSFHGVRCVRGPHRLRRRGPLDLPAHRYEAQLPEGGDAVVEADLFGDQAVFDLEHSRAGELHLLARAVR